MTEKTNRQVLLRSRPEGIPQEENFKIVEGAIPQIEDGSVLVHGKSGGGLGAPGVRAQVV